MSACLHKNFVFEVFCRTVHVINNLYDALSSARTHGPEVPFGRACRATRGRVLKSECSELERSKSERSNGGCRTVQVLLLITNGTLFGEHLVLAAAFTANTASTAYRRCALPSAASYRFLLVQTIFRLKSEILSSQAARCQPRASGLLFDGLLPTCSMCTIVADTYWDSTTVVKRV